MEIGIDFGTTFSTVCYGDVSMGDKACLSLAGSVYIPTELYIEKDGSYSIGHRARSEYRTSGGDLYINPKRWVGANAFNLHEFVSKLRPSTSVELDGNYSVKIGSLDDRQKQLSITTIIAMFIKACIREVEDLTGKPVTGVVCSVPAKYNSYKRSYLASALGSLGVPLRALINEPTAAALYGIAMSNNPSDVYGVFDFGGGTFDISFIARRNSIYGVVLSDGDNYLGGRDVDKKICDTISSRLVGKISQSTLSIIVADIKEQISTQPMVTEFPLLTDKGIENIRYTREDLDNDSRPFITRAIDLFVSNLRSLGNPNLTVILTGGSSALPLVKDMVSKIPQVVDVVFDSNSFRASVALGAKVNGDMLSGASDIRLVDCLSQTLSDELLLFHSAPIFIKSGCVPSVKSATYTVSGPEVPYAVFEGESPCTWLNEMTFRSVDTRPTSAEGSNTVTYEITIDGRLNLSVDGRRQVNLLVPPKADEKMLNSTYILNSGKYVQKALKLYKQAFESLYDLKPTDSDVTENEGVILDNYIELNFLNFTKVEDGNF